MGRLGRGGMGEVLLADRIVDAGVRLRCALKLVHPGRRRDPVYVGQILSEARIIAQLRHPNIVSILDVGRVGEQVWLAMEWIDGCDGRTLRRAARERGAAIPLRHVIYIVREALQGLHHAHQARGMDGRPLGIVHRDLSPGNILISRHGAVKLADFGVAAAAADGPARLRLVGKPQYIAPELYQGAPASVQSDIFALGATTWELLTMEPLFPRRLSFDELVERVSRFDPREAIEADLTLPDGIEPILLRALHPDPGQRYRSALEMLEDVSDFAYETGLRLLDAHFARYLQRLLAPPGHPTEA
ncbi:MAG: serine/threonine protein kinase [Deltaproteobacteria bacterium]|nr:MAG: serine/threonine protein kinase [Deltaproteobacteria bacterium]